MTVAPSLSNGAVDAASISVAADRPELSFGKRGPSPAERARSVLLRLLGLTVSIVLVLFIVGPLVWLAIGAFAKTWNAPSLLPQAWTLSWWKIVFAQPELGHSFWLSLRFAVSATALATVICLPAAYAIGRRRFPGRRVVLIGLFATNAFPKMGLFTSIATLFYSLNLMGTGLGVVIIQLLGTIVTMVWLPAAAFASVSPSMLDAARDAGAGPVRTFARITLPQAIPGIAVALILAFLACFDEAQGTYLIGSPTYITMPTQMYTLVDNYPAPAAAVFAIVLTIPSILLLLLVRRHILGGHLAEGFQIK
ncbi:putative spermidine/putrescine transport system permease protein [Nakamurella sp. UYEF19]|uniref:ABC transporter permease n=1 Tax=Nakamurella sp. UYEF19 TaxID=1756392 RepID=UPI00339A58C9